MKKVPLISIITVCYNEGKTIEKTCKSVVSQIEKDFEWIVIDGGSNDGTLKILKKYQKKMSYFISEKDGGVYDAMNKGISFAKGKFILFLNGGDFLFNSEVLAGVKKLMLKDKQNSQIYYGNLLYDNGEVVDFGKSSLDRRFFINKTISHQATFIQKELFDVYGKYNLNYKIVADFDFWVKVIIEGKAKVNYLPLIISVFNQSGTSTVSKNNRIHMRERNEVLLKYGLISRRKERIQQVKLNFLGILKRVGIYNRLRKNYRRIIKR